jgi:hypothetical protein
LAIAIEMEFDDELAAFGFRLGLPFMMADIVAFKPGDFTIRAHCSEVCW